MLITLGKLVEVWDDMVMVASGSAVLDFDGADGWDTRGNEGLTKNK